jgi:hypothetical protein
MMYNPENKQAVQAEILRLAALGNSIPRISRIPGMPPAATIREWVKTDAVFGTQWKEHRQVGMDAVADDLLDIADNQGGDVHRDRLRLDTRKWLLSRWAPQSYGDRVAVTGAEDGPPIQISDTDRAARIAQILEAAKRRREIADDATAGN